MFTMQDFKKYKEGTENTEEQLQMDRSMYIKGREGYPTAPEEGLSERATGCYMMGYNVSEWESER